MDLDLILHDVGEYGKYQKLMLWFVLLPSHLPFGIHYYSQIFMSLTPHHWCRGTDINPDVNVTYRPLTMWSRSDELTINPTISECYVPVNISQENMSTNSSSNFRCNNDYEYDKRELFEEDSIITKWNLVCDLAWLPSLALGIFFFGAFIGQWLYILVMNRFGRRMSFFSFLALQCLCGIITAFAPDLVYFIVLRFFVGVSTSAVATSPTELAKELVGPTYRKQISIVSQGTRSLGLLFLSVMVFLIRDWSHIALVTTLPFLALFLYWWVFPESPDWLKGKGRYEEVGRIFEVIAQANGRELTPEYIINLKRRFRIEGSMIEERRKNGTEARFTCWDLFYGPYSTKKSTAIIFMWFTSTTATVGLSLYSFELEGDLYLNFFVSAGAEVAAAAVAGVFRNRCGRRCSFCISSALGGALTLSIATTQTGTNSRLTMFAVAKLSISFSSIVLPLWTGELLPYVIRSIGMRLTDVLSFIGPVSLPFLYNQSRKTPGVPLLTLGSLQIAGAVVALLLPETIHQKPLQTLQDWEEFGKYRSWGDYFRMGPPKQEMKNGILKNRGPQQQSPILSLLRRQDSLRRASSEGEQEHSDPQSESSTDQGSFIETVKITVV